MPRSTRNIQRLTTQLLDQFGITKPPVPVQELSDRLNIRVIYTPFPDNPRLSGMLVREPHQVIMGINAEQGDKRQRFTIAHELGHFFLDPYKDVWVDDGIGSAQISYRVHSGSREMFEVEEVRANHFAAALLMPEEWVRRDFTIQKQKGIEWADEDALADKLAKDYNVSLQAMIIRLLELNLIGHGTFAE